MLRPAAFVTSHADGGQTLTSAPTADIARKIDPLLTRQLLTAGDDQFRVIVVMRDRPDPNRLAAPDRASLVSALQATAVRSQAGVLALLDQAQTAERAGNIRSLWINNTVAARVDRSLINALVARDDVALVKLDQYRRWIAPPSNPTSDIRSPQSVEWNIHLIHADQVWAALNITGTGVVVASMDTGVDWLHPALQAAYRGYNPKGPSLHWGNWFDATDDGAQYPVDGVGHGTHTMGILVGGDGIGVAPGARWITARIFDNSGLAYDSWIHAGFQWILAPGGDPAKAPDVLNNSWGNSDGTDVEFRNDVRLLNAAGIFTVFSNGNSGPSAGTVGAPASYPEALGVGATDRYDAIAVFSSRGPSPFGVIRPDLAAPGVNVRSSFPGAAYQLLSGTSMAAPHVAGVAALMRSAAPDLTITATRYALTSTALHPTTDTYPNNDYGWGRVDAYRAVLAVAHTGLISGVITRADSGQPIAAANVHAESIVGTFADAIADGEGHYEAGAAASVYTLTASAFGFAPQSSVNVVVITGTLTRRDFSLTPLPTGTVVGRITDLTGTQLLNGVLSVENSPITIAVNGTYSMELPIGTHVLRAESFKHHVVTATITIKPDAKITQNFALPDAPSILLVDSGRWYNGSEIQYYQQALDDLGYLYTDWPIRALPADMPLTSTLEAYDVVIWSSPFDSPGYIGADTQLDEYLRRGGRLMLSGQDVGYYDGLWNYSPYFVKRLLAQYVADDAPSRVLTGSASFAGQVVTITGAGGADNQQFPDVITSTQPLYTEPAFDYAPDQSGGQTIGLCRPYRAVLLSYGFEAINDRAARTAVMSRTLSFFTRPPITQRYSLATTGNPLIAPPGSIVTSTIDLYNFDEVMTTTFAIDIDPIWGASITPTLAMLGPCEHRPITVTASIPLSTSPGQTQALTISVHPIVSPGLGVSTSLILKSPGSVLLVDDDRWYPVDAPYRSALDANGITYDLYRVPVDWVGEEPATPSPEQLKWYPEVIWFTGYDWYQPLTAQNELTLTQYLTSGGRLMLSSQEYLARRDLNDFGRDVLGVLNYADDLTATVANGPAGSLFDGLQLQTLQFPYPNFSDALAPQPDAQVALIGQHAWPITLANTHGIRKSLFMSFGFESLPEQIRPEAMNRIVGYLSWLGQSSARFDRPVASSGDAVTLTIVATNDGAAAISHAAFTVTLPMSVTYAGGDALTWNGSLAPGQSVTHSMAVTIDAISTIAVPVKFDDLDHQLHFTATARLPINTPVFAFNLTPEPNPARPRQVVTWTLTAHNLGLDVPAASIIAQLPFDQRVISGSVSATIGAATYTSQTINWSGTILANQIVTMTYQMTLPAPLADAIYYGSAMLTDGEEVWHAENWLRSQPQRIYLLLIQK